LQPFLNKLLYLIIYYYFTPPSDDGIRNFLERVAVFYFSKGFAKVFSQPFLLNNSIWSYILLFYYFIPSSFGGYIMVSAASVLLYPIWKGILFDHILLFQSSFSRGMYSEFLGKAWVILFFKGSFKFFAQPFLNSLLYLIIYIIIYSLLRLRGWGEEGGWRVAVFYL